MSARRNIMLGTAGHVDHGKTAVVKLLTGCDTDSLAEEKQRGMTIDLGFAPCRLSDDRIVGVVDVPGHADFIRNMVAGAHGIDVVILVVAADDGIMPQTREHLNILTLMGLQHGLIALTKIDLVEPARRSEVIDDVRRLLAGTFLEQAPICPLSTITGEGYGEFYDTLNATAAACEDRLCSGIFHLWVEDVFTIHGAGTVITGIPTAGRARVGDHLVLVPSGKTGRVRRLQVYGDDATEGRAGECTALNLAELDHQQARRGLVLTEPDLLSAVEWCETDLQLLTNFRGELKDQTEVHLHIGTASLMAKVVLLERPRQAPGERQFAQLRLSSPLGIMPGQRFVLRAQDPEGAGLTTIGGGRIVGIGNVRLKRNKPWVLEALAARRDALAQPAAWCETLLKQAGLPISLPEWSRLALVRPDELAQLAASLQQQGRVLALPDGAWVHQATITRLSDKLLAFLTQFHQDHPERAGLESAELQTFIDADKRLFAVSVQQLLAQKRLTAQGNFLSLAGRRVVVLSEQEQIIEKVAGALKQAGWAPASPSELAVALNLPLTKITPAFQRLKERGEAVQISPDICLHRDALDAARNVVLKLFAKASSFTTMDFRDALGVSRKFAVPLLDFLDARRYTVRNGNLRTPGAEAKKLLSPPPQ